MEKWHGCFLFFSSLKWCTHSVWLAVIKMAIQDSLGLGHLFIENKKKRLTPTDFERLKWHGERHMANRTTNNRLLCIMVQKWNQINRFTGAKKKPTTTKTSAIKPNHSRKRERERQSFNICVEFIVEISMIRNRNRSNLSVGLITNETATLKNRCRKF